MGIAMLDRWDLLAAKATEEREEVKWSERGEQHNMSAIKSFDWLIEAW